MKISQKGIDLIKKYEGCYLTAYKCPAGIWTIGYGHTAGVYEGMTITQEQAEEFLRQDLVKYENNVNKFNSTYNWNQNEFDALVSFAFNIGSINKLTANGTRNRAVIADKMLEYCKAGGKTLNGLLKRRNEERALFLEKGEEMAAIEVSKYINIFKLGSKGEQVGLLQQILSEIGYEPGTADGVFGNNTKKAVMSFQNDAGLTADGIVGINTWDALCSIETYSRKENGEEYLTKNFKAKEFASKDGYEKIVLHFPMIRQLQKIRDHFGKPVTINSGYRSKAHNKKVGGASNSFHVKGRAFDIVVKGVRPADVARYASQIGIKGVIQYNTFTHVDSRPTRYWARNDNGKVSIVSSF